MVRRLSRREPVPEDTLVIEPAPVQPGVTTETASTGGERVYAVGDIHGRLDLFDTLLGHIFDDLELFPAEAAPRLVLLGDYVDRGPNSREVLDRVLELEADPRIRLHALRGNHEHAMLAFLDDPTLGPTWADYGCGPTLASYGVAAPRLRSEPEGWAAARDALADAMPAAHRELLERLPMTLVVGDYLFVHAGLRPGVGLEDQTVRDLMWIREPFLSAPEPFSHVVVHGHTPQPEVNLGPRRIGVDTGAYATNLLSCVRLEGEARSVLRSLAA